METTNPNSWLLVLALILGVVLVGTFYCKSLNSSDLQPPGNFASPRKESLKPKPKKEFHTPIMAKSYKEALYLGRENKKQIFLYFEADWCSWCDKMKQILNLTTIKRALEPYIVYYVDGDKEKNLVEKYSVKGYPGYVLITPDETVEKKAKGYKSEKEFLKWLGRT